MNARERIEAVLDPGSFRELGTLAGCVTPEGERPTPADAFPSGHGEIHGRPVLIGAEDFTDMGGSIGLAAADKRFRLTQLAVQEKIEHVREAFKELPEEQRAVILMKEYQGLKFHEISGNFTKFQEISRKSVRFHEISCRFVKFHAISRNFMKLQEITCNVTKFQEISRIFRFMTHARISRKFG